MSKTSPEDDDSSSNINENNNNNNNDKVKQTIPTREQHSPVRELTQNINQKENILKNNAAPPTAAARDRLAVHFPSSSNVYYNKNNSNKNASTFSTSVRKLRVFDDITTSSSSSSDNNNNNNIIATPTKVMKSPVKKDSSSSSSSFYETREGLPKNKNNKNKTIQKNIKHNSEKEIVFRPITPLISENASPTSKDTPVAMPVSLDIHSPREGNYNSNNNNNNNNNINSREGMRANVENEELDLRLKTFPISSKSVNIKNRGDVYDDNNTNNKKDDKKEKQKKSISTYLENIWEFGQGMDNRLVIMFISIVISLILSIIGVPLSQVDFIGGACYTYWGYKSNCDARIYTNRTAFITCSPVKNRLNVGAGFGIMTLILIFISLFLFIMFVFHNFSKLRLAIIIILSIAFVFQMIAWGAIAGIYTSRYCEDLTLPRNSAYGVAFGMSLTIWFLLLFGILSGAALYIY